ncbi:MAG: DNA internalization-related competence protein ComEC/Rec2 [Clostridia bacterium]|nr:DNA internalization-related competence protein ComEC/Rec2 [Clostridia bacterium]
MTTRRPLFLFALSLALSVAVLQFAPAYISLAVCAVCAAVSVVIILFFKRNIISRPYFIVLFAVFFAGGLLFVWTHCYIEPVYYFADKPSHIVGYISDLESKTNHGYKYTLRCESIESKGVSYARPFDIALYTDAPISARPYERIEITAVTSLPEEADKDGDFDSRAFLRSKGIYLEATLKSDLLMKRTDEVCGNLFMRTALGLKRYVSDAMLLGKVMSNDSAALVSAVTMNYKGRLTPHQKEVFASVGLSHMLAASGMHLSILVFSVLLLFRMMGLRRRYALCAALFVVVGFAALAGFSVSVVRSGAMFFVMAGASIFGKSYDPYTALGCAAVCILFQNPFAIGDAGFILSAVSTLGILLFSQKLMRVLTIKRKGVIFKVFNYFIGIICVTLAATSLAAPFSMFIFGGLSLISPISNLLVAPLLPVIFILCALSAIFAATPATQFFQILLEGICRYIIYAAESLSKLPYSYLVTKGDIYYVWIAFAAAVVMICIASKEKIRTGQAVCIILASLLFTGLFSGPSVPSALLDTGFRLSVLDVGQGQCVLLQSEGKTFVIDCGTSSYGCDAGQTATEYLKRNGINHIDALILSHYHDDHANGAKKLAAGIKTDMIIMPAWDDDDGMMESLTETAEELGISVCKVEHDSETAAGDLVMRIYADHMYNAAGETKKDYNANEKNLAVYVEYDKSSALIEGDMPGEDEGYIAEKNDLDTDVLIVAHHGSKYSSYADFLNMSTPNIAVISVGSDNSYSHPSDETLDRFKRLGAHVWRTDNDGTVVIDTVGDGMFTVYSAKK